MGKKNKTMKAWPRAVAVKRDRVKRSERVGPTPETAAKLPKDHLETLLRLGPEGGGISDEQCESLFGIERAYRSVTKDLEERMGAMERVASGRRTEMTPSEVRCWELWFIWSEEYQRRFDVRGHLVAEWIVARRDPGPGSVQLFRRAANLWDKVEDDYTKAKQDARG